MAISYLFSPLFLIKILFCFCDAQQGAVAVCHAGKGSSSGQVTTCESSQCEPVCLVCGNYITKGVKWITANVLIAQGNYTLGIISGSKVNTCHGNSSSLRLDSCHERINDTIRCELDGYVLAEFRLKNLAKETLTIVGETLQYTEQNITLARGLNVYLLCVIQNASPPVTLEWLVDEKLNYTHRFTSSEANNFSIPLLINTSSAQDSITCNSYGGKQNMSQRLLITNISTTTDNNCKEKGGTNNIDMEENVCYVGLDNLPTGMIRTETEPMMSLESEETKDKKPLLRKQIQSGQPFEYWSARISTKDSHSYSCVAKKLSDQATIRDYENMKNLVQSLSLLDMGSGFVQISHSSIQPHEQERAAEACNEVDETQPYPTFVCKVMPEDPVCLVCPVYQEVDVEWFTTETRITYGNFYVGKYNDLNVNICHQTNASLRLKSCRDELKYFQCRQGKKTMGEFKFICEQEEILVIERDSETIKDDTIILNEDIVIRLRCLAQQVLPPLTMEWFVDSKRVYTESFFQYFSEETNFSISLEIYTGTIVTSITCVAYGNYIQNMSRSISVVKDTLHTTQTPEELQPRQLENTWVTAVVVFGLISIGLFVCVYITVRQFRLTRNRQGNINSSNQMNVLDKDVLDTEQSIKRKKILTEGSRQELPTTPVDEENSQNSLNSGGSEPNYYSTADVISGKDPRMLNENDISIIIKIKIGKIYKRWMGSINLANETNKCVVVTTLTETLFRKKEIHWEAYIRKCLELPASNHLAKIEAISIQSNKLFLISEHLVCESMHKVLSRDTKDEKDIYCCSSLSVPDVIKRISGILEGMDILNTFGFLHPGLTTKKVLLTKGGHVKLFDFCLARDAPKIAALKKEKIRSVTLNQFPPEMLMLNHYTESSDVWSTAVVIWEIMKAGIPPFPVDREVRFDEVIIKPSVPWPEKYSQIRDKILFDCWNYNCSLRPSIHQLRATFVAIFEKLIADSSYEIPIPTTYLPMRAPDTAQHTYADQIYHAGV